jgi:hypothetical protein
MEDPVCVVTALGVDEFFELDYTEGVQFVIDSPPKRLWATYRPPLTVEDLATYLLGPIAGFILRQRRIIALHASAVRIGESAVILAGASARGKSTLATAFAMRSASVLCDDVACIKEQPNKIEVEPGYPRICLWPDAAQTLFGMPDALPRLTPTWNKRFLALDGEKARFERQRRPLSVVYVLAKRRVGANLPVIEEMGPRDALLELVQNTYMNWLLDREQRAAEFEVLSRLVTRVPVRRIVPHCDLARIGKLCDLIMADSSTMGNTDSLTHGQSAAVFISQA